MKLPILLFLFVFGFSPNKANSQVETLEINFDSLKVVLDSVHYFDQFFFNSGLKGKEEYTDEELNIIKNVKIRQAQSLDVVSKILDIYGWLGAKDIGQTATNALFLTIQHNDLKTQIKYLPLLQKAVLEEKVDASDVAMLEDRMAIKRGIKQKYGSQLPPHPITGKPMVWPIENPEKVDDLRVKIGLPIMNEYVSWWEIKWDLEQHLEYTKELEEKRLMNFYLEKEE